ncbi:DUF4845 domain-containing protein [Thiohalocapsa sp. ML1]|jgi:hypothetical protein|uniref:DUF4845 domain-containing protein n=1 Tax=Thiohalocapsa sp. ML1 TaxID=1431688 RepID=UPI0012E3B5ED|nr:DUF4845 domain-containing protein [Thiohalocapsa sp. ML1]
MTSHAASNRQPPSRRRPSARAQRGMGFGGVMIIIVLVVFFANLAIAMFPAYATFWQVRGIMDRLQEKPDVIAQGPRGIMSSLSSQLGINSIRDVGTQQFKLERDPDGINLIADYEVRKHLFFNVDVVMAFDHKVLLKKP